MLSLANFVSFAIDFVSFIIKCVQPTIDSVLATIDNESQRVLSLPLNALVILTHKGRLSSSILVILRVASDH